MRILPFYLALAADFPLIRSRLQVQETYTAVSIFYRQFRVFLAFSLLLRVFSAIMKKHSGSERLLLDLMKKGSLRHPTTLKLASSPYSQPHSSDKPHSKSKDTRPSISDATLTVIEEKVRRPGRLARNQSFSSEKTHISPPPNQRQSCGSAEAVMALNKALTERLKDLGGAYDVRERFAVFQGVFALALGVDPTFGLLLRRIKAGYEEYLSLCVKPDAVHSQTERQLAEFQTVLEQEQLEKETLLGTIVDLRREKTALTSKLVSKTAQVKALERQLDESVSTAKTGEDRVALQAMVRTLQEEVFLLRNREQLLTGVVKSAQDRGFPVEQLLAKHRKTASLHRSKFQGGASTQLSPITPENDGSMASFARDMDISASSKEGK